MIFQSGSSTAQATSQCQIRPKKKKKRKFGLLFTCFIYLRYLSMLFFFYFWLHKQRYFIVCHFYLFTRKLLKLIFFFYGCVGKMCYSFRSLELKILACSLTCWWVVVWYQNRHSLPQRRKDYLVLILMPMRPITWVSCCGSLLICALR